MSLLNKLFGRKDGTPELEFWKWFESNSDELKGVVDCTENICGELNTRMTRIDEGLVFAFGPAEDGAREFIVSADGNRKIFPVVQRLVAAAPDIPGWRIIAFRPAAGFGMEMRIGEATLDPDDILYLAKVEDGFVNLTLYLKKDLPDASEEDISWAVFLLLDYGLGEYIVETKIGGVEIQPLPHGELSTDLTPLKELPKLVHRLI